MGEVASLTAVWGHRRERVRGLSCAPRESCRRIAAEQLIAELDGG
ncbi:hypothetical protein ACFY12_31295 [Streptomyces sp. NPDC001339]